ncbi:putative Hepar_II_III_N domain-containing protein [Vibrio chagasii]|nr:putative Hepar_II_III_N domain-containing protein [Vibrio chagasii]CAH7094172.1 putative Hepar_II_III_N domain-containing protein [Vibrio chagasii]CAH7119296.1 putative Hepar_II_III_N domain-containing protein [Vibrio chagasii]
MINIYYKKSKRLLYYFFGLILDIFNLIAYYVECAFFNLKPLSFIETKRNSRISCFISKAAEQDFLDGKVQVLSNTQVHFENWWTDPHSGYSWTCKWHKISNGERPAEADIKVPWEIGRLQELTYFAMYSDDSKVRKRIEYLINDFVNKNPPYLGVQWACPMDVSIRSVNIVILLTKALRVDVGHLNDKKIKVWMKHALRHITYYNEKNGNSRNNHYFSNLMGQAALLYFQVFCSETSPSTNLRKRINKVKCCFFEELEFQFDDDGFNFEGSINYHRLVSEISLITYLFLKELGCFSEEENTLAKDKINKILTINRYNHNGDFYHNIGDTDSGFVLDFNRKYCTNDNSQLIKDLRCNGEYLLSITDVSKFDIHLLYDSMIKVDCIQVDNLITMSKYPSSDSSELQLNVGSDSFESVFINKSIGIAKLWFNGGWILIKFPGVMSSGHSHYDHFRVELKVGGIYYSLFSGTKTYLKNCRYETRVTNYNRTNEKCKKIDQFAQLPLVFDGPEIKSTTTCFSVSSNLEYIKVELSNGFLTLDSNTRPFIKTKEAWTAYGFTSKVNLV